MTQLMNFNNKLFYDDYAHHPTEITAVLKACRENFKKRKIISIFQPHRYSRLNLCIINLQKAFIVQMLCCFVQYIQLEKKKII